MSMHLNHELRGTRDQTEEIIRRLSRGKMIRTGSILRLEFKRLLWNTVVGSTKVVKRGVDILISSAAILALVPVFLVVALLIRLDSPGPVLFKQTRVGRWGKTFSFWKLRSMYIDAEERSILGAWAGKEWRYVSNGEFISTKENLALGSYKDGKHCLLVYRLQESTSGRRLADKSLLIRFSPPKS